MHSRATNGMDYKRNVRFDVFAEEELLLFECVLNSLALSLSLSLSLVMAAKKNVKFVRVNKLI